MKDEIVMNGCILYADLMNMTNQTTGEVSQMTKVVYTVDIENTDKHSGVGMLECYLQGNKLKILEQFTKQVEISGKKYLQVYPLVFETRFIKNGQKLYIKKINNVDI